MEEGTRNEEPTAKIVQRVQQRDPEAERQLYERYADLILHFVNKRISEKLAREVDAEDVMQDAYKSLFSAIRHGNYTALGCGELRKILITIAERKLKLRERRLGQRERLLTRKEIIEADAVDGEPTPAEAAQVLETLEQVLRDGDEKGREVVRLFYFEAATIPTIAQKIALSERSTRRLRDEFKKAFLERIFPDGEAR